jgi:N-acetylmuramoyl-L-alanine amidase
VRQVKSLLTGLCLWLAGQGPVAAAPEFQSVRLWAAPDHTRVVFDVSAPVKHTLFSLTNPDRLVIDVPAAQLADTMRPQAVSGGLVKGVRTAMNKKDTLRIVLDLKEITKPRSFSLKPNDQYGHRLVLDLYKTTIAGADVPQKAAPGKVVANKPTQLRDLVIAIDAGHGGDDPGAIGRRGTREKDVVLAIARRLADLVRKEPGMRPVLVREGDYYVGLRQRINKARKHNADLFISIHADGFRDSRARGSSVYVLSRRGASSEMGRWLEARENAADLAGGVRLDDKDDLLAEVLLDLSQSATIEASFEVAGNGRDEAPRQDPQVNGAAGRVRGAEVARYSIDPGGDGLYLQSQGGEQAARQAPPAGAGACHAARYTRLLWQAPAARYPAGGAQAYRQERRHPERDRTTVPGESEQFAWL